MRCSSIDEFRGLSIYFMFIANFILLFGRESPAFLSHALSGKVQPFDLIAPFFGFMMGLCLSFSQAYAQGMPYRVLRRTVLLFLTGYLPFFLLRVFTGESLWPTITTTWGILETWALAYAVTYLISFVRVGFRIPLALGMALLYQVLLLGSPWAFRTVLSMREGGPLAVLSWSVVCVTGSVMGGTLLQGSHSVGRWVPVGFTMLAGGVLLHVTVGPMDRLSVSPAYTVFAAGFSLLAFALFYRVQPGWGVLFREAGKYPLLAWITQGLVYGPVYCTIGLSYFDWPTGSFLAILISTLLLVFTSITVKAGLSLKL